MRTLHVLLGAIGSAALISGCSGDNNGNPVPVSPGSAPTASAVASAKPTASPTTSATATPSPTPTPVSIPSGSSVQSICAFTGTGFSGSYPPVPGTYTLLESEGDLVGSSYTQSFGAYEAVSVAATTAPATAAPTATPVPTATPSGSPTYVYEVSTGNYSVPAYSITPSASASPGATPIAVSASSGCFLVVQLIQPTPNPANTPVVNADAIGIPFDINAYENNTISATAVGPQGTIPTFGFSSAFTPASGGTGSFTLDNGVVGSFTVGPQATYTSDKVKRMQAILRRQMHVARTLR